jgi:protease-4
VFTGRQALKMGLVDTLGTYEDAIKITAKLAGIKGEPSIVKERKRGMTFIDYLLGNKLEEIFGLKEKLLEQPILQYRMLQGF